MASSQPRSWSHCVVFHIVDRPDFDFAPENAHRRFIVDKMLVQTFDAVRQDLAGEESLYRDTFEQQRQRAEKARYEETQWMLACLFVKPSHGLHAFLQVMPTSVPRAREPPTKPMDWDIVTSITEEAIASGEPLKYA